MNKFLYMIFSILLWFSVTSVSNAADEVLPELQAIQNSWAKAKYELPEEKRESAFAQLAEQAAMLAKQYPDRAEPLVWQAIILSTEAGEAGGLGALSLVKDARKLLLEAEKINPEVLQGSVYTSLGSLYYQVPGWPLGFGDKDKAERYLQRALAINPQGIDPNYFYADYLYEQGRYDEAIEYVKRTLDAPARTQRPLADNGRRREASQLMQKIKQKLSFSGDFTTVSKA